MCPPASRGVSVPRLAAGLSLPPCPSALQSCPHFCSLEQKQLLVFPPLLRSIRLTALGVSRGACVGVRLGGPLCPHLSRMACDAAGPSGHLGHICEFVAPPPCCCLGPPAFRPLSHVLNLRVFPLPPSLWRVVPSTPLDLTGTVAPAVDFPITLPDSRHKVLCRKAAMIPAPFSFVPLSRFFQTVWCSVCKSIILRIAFVNIFVNILVLSLIIFNIFMTWL